MAEVCRICMSSSVTLMDIFAKRQLAESEPSLADMIKDVAKCELKPDDKLSKNICISCILDAQTAFRFKRSCEQSHKLLTEELEKQEVEPIIKTMEAIWKLRKRSTAVKLQQKETQNEELSSNSLASTCDSKPKKTKDCRSLRSLKNEHKTDFAKIPFQCKLCSKEFTYNGHLIVHMRTHTGQRTFKCPQCPKIFAAAANLSSHKVIHKERAHQCPHCDHKVARKSDLRAHIRVHTGERPYKCSYCSKTFNQATHLSQHKRLHTGECPYKCPHCTEQFPRKQNLKNHIEIKHCDQQFNVSKCGIVT